MLFLCNDHYSQGMYHMLWLSLYNGCTPTDESCLPCWALSRLRTPLRPPGWRKKPIPHKRFQQHSRTIVAVNNLTDTFGEWFTNNDIRKMLRNTHDYPKHRFVIQTRRYKRAHQVLHNMRLPNVWLAMTVRTQAELLTASAYMDKLGESVKVRAYSFQPLLGEIDLNALEIMPDWCTVSGRFLKQGRQDCNPKHIESLLLQLEARSIPTWFHGWGNIEYAREVDGMMQTTNNMWRSGPEARRQSCKITGRQLWGKFYDGLPEPVIITSRNAIKPGKGCRKYAGTYIVDGVQYDCLWYSLPRKRFRDLYVVGT